MTNLEYLNQYIEIADKDELFGVIAVQRICRLDYNKAQGVIDYGLKEGILIKDQNEEWGVKVDPQYYKKLLSGKQKNSLGPPDDGGKEMKGNSMIDDNNPMQSVIKGILDFSRSESTEVFNTVSEDDTVRKAVDAANNNNYSEFDLHLLYPFRLLTDGLLNSVTTNDNAQFIFMHSDYVESHFEKMIERYEGSPYSADKSGVILSGLLRYFISGDEINFNHEQEYTYHLPKKVFTTHAEIEMFFRGLYHFYYGDEKLYLEALSIILNRLDHEEKNNVEANENE